MITLNTELDNFLNTKDVHFSIEHKADYMFNSKKGEKGKNPFYENFRTTSSRYAVSKIIYNGYVNPKEHFSLLNAYELLNVSDYELIRYIRRYQTFFHAITGTTIAMKEILPVINQITGRDLK